MNVIIPKPALLFSHALVFTLLLITLLGPQATWQSGVPFSPEHKALHSIISQLFSAH